MVGAFHQHTATATGGVIHAVARLRVNQLNHQLHHGLWRIELAAFLTGVVGKLLDQILVGIAQHVSLIQVVIAQLVLVKMTQQALQGRIRQHSFVTVLRSGQYVLQFRVIGLDSRERLVQGFTNILSARYQIEPARTDRELAPFVLYLLLGIAIAQAFVLHQLGYTLIEHVVVTLKEEQAEDVVLEVRGVDGTAQNVRRFPEPGLQRFE